MAAKKNGSFRVLLVEDDPVSAHLFSRCLRENSRFSSSLDHVTTVEEALKKLKTIQYHLLLVESQLKRQSGLQLLNKIKERRLTLPCVLMLPMRDEKLIQEARALGISDFIIKNEKSPSELMERVRKFDHRVRGRAKPGSKEERRRIYLDDPSLEEDQAGTPEDPSVQDELTGTYTHSNFHEILLREHSRAARYGYPLSCIMLDIDHFKAINEEWGHRLGDALLQESAILLFENCRLSDSISRYGGEEFAILLPHVDYEKAREIASRLRVVFANHHFKTSLGEIKNTTVSIGIASCPEDKMENGFGLINFATQALFRSKAAGRNRISLYNELVPVIGQSIPVLKISESKVLEFQRRMTEISDLARRAYLDASKALISALENKDRFTAGHSGSCANYSMETAEAMGMSVEEAEIVQHAALLHDIGKICIPDNILLKPAKLTFGEYEAMKQHPYLGYKILKPISFLQQEALLVLHHHEWFNGEGYPCRLKGNEIPLGARIIAVIDAFDTMRVAGGRYKKTMTIRDAVDEMIQYAGTQFDPNVVQTFIAVLKARGDLLSNDYDHKRLEKAIRDCS